MPFPAFPQVIDAQTPAPALDAEEKDGADAGENADLRNVDPRCAVGGCLRPKK